jgi:acyl-CoA thioester hydrolase
MTEHAFRHTHRVTYADCTVGNHVYYSRYLDLLEAARGELFRHTGMTLPQWQEQNTIFPVVECRVRYRYPARYDDVLTVLVWVALAAGARLNFAYRIVNQAGGVVLEAETFHACAGLNERPGRLPERLLATLRPYMPAPAAQG